MGKLGLKNTVKGRNKKQEAAKIEKIIETMHDEKTKKLTIRMPDSLHRKLKAKVALDGNSINEYILGLVNDALIDEKRIDI